MILNQKLAFLSCQIKRPNPLSITNHIITMTNVIRY